MGWLFLVVCFISCSIHRSDSFDRSAVEGHPEAQAQQLLRSGRENAEGRLPLRDAVEGRPDPMFTRTQRLGLEDMVIIDNEGFSFQSNNLLEADSPRAQGKFYRGAVEAPPDNFQFFKNAAFEPDNAHHYDERVNERMEGEEEITANALQRDQSYSLRSGKDLKVICYWGAWSIYRPSPMDFSPGDLDPFGCTHIIYSFTGLDNSSLTLVSLDPEYDLIQGGYKSVLRLRRFNPNLKVMIAVGGWNEGGKKYSKMASTKENRRRFIDSVLEFIDKHGFDGFDLDWEYPGATDRQGTYADKENFARLCEEMSEEFRPKGLLLSAAVSPAIFRVNEGYDVPRLGKALDFINVMTYDLHGSWDRYADHHAPIRKRPFDQWGTANLHADGGLSYWIKKGAPAEKIIFGIPFYGRSFTLGSSQNTKPRSSIKGPGKKGKFTKEKGFLAYYELCSDLADGGWNEEKDPVGSPYAYKGDQWVGYDTEEYIVEKMKYVVENGLGGAMVWAIDLDDYRGVCGSRWPLLRALNRGLGKNFVPGTVEITSSTKETTSTTSGTRPSSTTSAPQTTTLPPKSSTTQQPQSTQEPETSTTRKTTVPTTQPIVLPSVTPSGSECPENGDGYARDASDCTVFYQCAGGVKFTMVCPAGLYFDPSINVCNWPEQVECTSVTKAAQEQFVCEEDGLFNDPSDCSNYYWCAGGRKYRMSCGANLHFDAALGVCNFPGLAQCNPGVKTLVKAANEEDNFLNGLSLRSDTVGKKLLCYITSWSWTRSGDGSFVPENVDPFLCTHIVYAYAALDPDSLVIRAGDKWTDIDNKMYERAISLKEKNPDLKVLLGLGGWADSSGDKYSRMVSDKAKRAQFTTHATAFLKAYGFDGLHIDWQYPTCWHLDCSKGPQSDRENYGKLLRELKKVFRGSNLHLSGSISADKKIIDEAYDAQALSDSLDLISVMAYDYHGPWENEAGYIAPTRSKDGNDVESTMRYLEFKGFSTNKLLVGMSTYGRSYLLAEEGDASKSLGSGSAGPYTKEPGLMAYYEICNAAKNLDWSQGRNKLGSFITQKRDWVNYEDAENFENKADFINQAGFAGASVWSLDMDDFNNICCEESFRLTRAIARGLGLRNDTYKKSCTTPVVVTPPPVEFEEDWDDGSNTPKPTDSTLVPTSKWPRPNTPTEGTTEQSTTQPPKTTTTRATTTPSATTTTRSTTTVPTTTTSTTTKAPTTTPTTTTSTTTTASTTRTSTRQTTTTQTTTTTQKPIAPESCIQGEYYPDPSGGCNKFAACVGGNLIMMNCAPGLSWNADGKYCDYPENVDCERVASIAATMSMSFTAPVAAPAVTQSSTDKRQEVTPGTDVDSMIKVDYAQPCATGQLAPMPGNCNQYQLCVYDKWLAMTCPEGLHWNQGSLICDWPSNANCKAEEITEPTVAPTTPPSTEPPKPPTTAEPTSKPEETTTSAETKLPSTTQMSSTTIAGSTSTIVTTTQPITSPVIATKAPTSGTSTEPPKPTGDDSMKVICYFTNWAWYRPGAGKYTPDNIDASLCTHMVYGFATLDSTKLIMKPYDTWADLDNKFYQKVVALKEKGVKVVIALGGWNDSAGNKYSRLVNSPEARKNFIDNAIVFIEKYGFEGIDLDWEYPVCWQVDCSKGPSSDKEGFALWVKEISEAFKPRGWTVSAAVSPSKTVVDAGYDVSTINQYLDWIGVMTYDYYGNWDKKTGHVSPLYHFPESDFDYFNTNYTINYWLSKGATRDKLTAGVPLYGQALSLRDKNKNGLNAPATNPGQAGEFTRQAGFLAYYEICHRVNIKGGWTVVSDPEHRWGSYAYRGNQWVSFDDSSMIERKGRLFKEWGLAGVIVWAPDLDDFRNRCGCEPHPLLRALNRGVGRLEGAGPDCSLQTKEVQTVEPTPGSGGETGTGAGGNVGGSSSGACEDGTTVRDPNNCGKYKLCNHGAYIEQYCPNGLFWNEDRCDWPANTDCKPGGTGSTSTKPPVTQPPQGSTSEPPSTGASSTKPPGPTQPTTVTTLKPVPSSTATTTRAPTPSTERPATEDTGVKVICYFTNWAWYRPGDGKYTPSNIDESLCTHIVYGFATLDRNKLVMKVYDSWADLDNNFYKRVVALREKGVRVSIALGGWNDSLGNKYSLLVNDPEARKKFVKNAVEFVEKYGFDGLDLDWEYPVCWQVDCNAGPPSDKEGFSAWVKELSAEFKPRGWTLSAAVSPSKKVIDAGYDVPVLSEYLDWIGVMTYDYHGQWDKKTGHVAPLYYHPEDDIEYFNTNFTMNYWKQKGAASNKLTMGVPLYGQAFTLADKNVNGLNAKATGAGSAGQYTRQAGFLAYYEICSRIQKGGWTVVQDPESRMGPYAYKGNQWVSFDDADMIKRKAQKIKDWDLAGVIVWAPDLDDFRNKCGCEPHPLLRALNRGLGRLQSPDPQCEV